jgi:hypothetical protein
MLARLLDLMRRADPDYCAANSLQPTTDVEWDAGIAEAGRLPLGSPGAES